MFTRIVELTSESGKAKDGRLLAMVAYPAQANNYV